MPGPITMASAFSRSSPIPVLESSQKKPRQESGILRTIIALGGLANRCALSGIATVTSPADVRSALLPPEPERGIESAAADHEEMPARVLVNVERLPRQIFPDVGFDGAFGIFGDFLHITRRNADVRDFDSAPVGNRTPP